MTDSQTLGDIFNFRELWIPYKDKYRFRRNSTLPISRIGLFVSTTNNISSRLEIINQHSIKTIKKRIKDFNLPKDSVIIDLMIKTENIELQPLKTEAFFELLASCTSMSIDKVKSSYEELMN